MGAKMPNETPRRRASPFLARITATTPPVDYAPRGELTEGWAAAVRAMIDEWGVDGWPPDRGWVRVGRSAAANLYRGDGGLLLCHGTGGYAVSYVVTRLGLPHRRSVPAATWVAPGPEPMGVAADMLREAATALDAALAPPTPRQLLERTGGLIRLAAHQARALAAMGLIDPLAPGQCPVCRAPAAYCSDSEDTPAEEGGREGE